MNLLKRPSYLRIDALRELGKEVVSLRIDPAPPALEFLNRDKWIPYPKAVSILKDLEKMLALPRKLRMPGRLIYGETNNGKSSIVRQFIKQHPPTDGDDAMICPIVYVVVPEEGRLGDFYGDILYELMAPYANTAKTGKKAELVRYYFEKLGVRMLIVDEIHNILSGTTNKQRSFMIALKNLSNKLHIPIVLVGTKDALIATNTDNQIRNRFRPISLPRWNEKSREYGNLLASIEILLPLKKPSGLATNKLGTEIYDLSGGYIGEIMELLTSAAELAIESGEERITKEILYASSYMEWKKEADMEALAKT